MKNLSNKKILPIVLLSLGLAMTGCSVNSNKTFTEDEALEFINDIENDIFDENILMNDVKKEIDSSIDKINNKELSSQLINNYIYKMYNEADKYNTIITSLYAEINQVKKMLDIDTIDLSLSSKIPSSFKILKVIFEDMKNKGLILLDEEGALFVEVDMDYIINLYGDYLNEDLISYMKFRTIENETSVYNSNKGQYKIDELFKRANLSLNGYLSDKKSSQAMNWSSSFEYYFNIITSTNHQGFVDDDSKLTDSSLKEMEEELQKYKDTELFKVIDGYLKVLKENNNDTLSEKVNVYIDDFYKELYKDSNNEIVEEDSIIESNSSSEKK